jgi:hypothetical protein
MVRCTQLANLKCSPSFAKILLLSHLPAALQDLRPSFSLHAGISPSLCITTYSFISWANTWLALVPRDINMTEKNWRQNRPSARLETFLIQFWMTSVKSADGNAPAQGGASRGN